MLPDFAAVQQQILDYLKANQFAGGGLVVGLAGAALAIARNLPRRFAAWSWRRVTIEIEVTNSDLLFSALEFWMAKKGFVGRPRNFRAQVRDSPPRLSYGEPGANVGQPTPPAEPASRVLLSPGEGRHWLWFDRRLVLVERSTQEKTDRYGGQVEKFTFNFFTRDRQRVNKLLASVVEECTPKERQIGVFTADGRSWERCAYVPVRCPQSLVLKAGLFEDLSADLRRFFDRRDWYRRVGIPHRRGYLLTGPPGNGKSTTILVLAGLLNAPLHIVDLASPFMTDDKLRDLMASAPAGAFFIFEDIDVMFAEGGAVAKRAPVPTDDDDEDDEDDDTPSRRNEKSGGGNLTMSGLLNALDGVASSDGRVVFMSTNHPEKLDPALIRPGRIDRRVELGNATAEQAERMFLRFFTDWLIDPALVEGGARHFGELMGGGGISMATVQSILLESGEDPRRAIELAVEHVKHVKPGKHGKGSCSV